MTSGQRLWQRQSDILSLLASSIYILQNYNKLHFFEGLEVLLFGCDITVRVVMVNIDSSSAGNCGWSGFMLHVSRKTTKKTQTCYWKPGKGWVIRNIWTVTTVFSSAFTVSDKRMYWKSLCFCEIKQKKCACHLHKLFPTGKPWAHHQKEKLNDFWDKTTAARQQMGSVCTSYSTTSKVCLQASCTSVSGQYNMYFMIPLQHSDVQYKTV